MGDHRAHDSAATAGLPASRDRHAGGDERCALRVAYGMPMAAIAESFSTAFHRLQLFLGVDALPRARPHPPHVACEGARGGGPRSKSQRRHHRYAGCERPKSGSQRDPIGYDAGKKTKGIKRNVIVDTIGLLLGIAEIPANIRDRDCAANLIRKTRQLLPSALYELAKSIGRAAPNARMRYDPSARKSCAGSNPAAYTTRTGRSSAHALNEI